MFFFVLGTGLISLWSTLLWQEKSNSYTTRNRQVTKPVKVAVNKAVLFGVHMLEDLRYVSETKLREEPLERLVDCIWYFLVHQMSNLCLIPCLE